MNAKQRRPKIDASGRFRVRVTWRYGDKAGVYDETDHGCGTAWMDDGEPNYFMWEEGNYSCDCNRSVFFGLAPNIDESFPCGETIKIVSIEPLEFE